MISIFCWKACVRNAFLNAFWHRLVQFGHQFTRNFVLNATNCALEICEFKFRTP